MIKVLHVTTVHPRFDIRIFRKECLTLKQAGFDVHLLVADGEGDCVKEGIVFHGLSRVRGRLLRMFMQPIRAFFMIIRLKPDIVHFHDPELLPLGLFLGCLGYKVIYDSHEDLPRTILSKTWIRPVFRRIVSSVSEAIENFCAGRCAAVVAATPYIASRFARVNSKTISVTNYPVISEASPNPARSPERNTFIYVGAITKKRGIREMIIAANLINGRIILAGSFEDESLRSEITQMPEWKSVQYVGYVDHGDLWGLMARSLAGLITLHPEPNYIHSIPNKMFEYMAGGIPIICSNFDSWRPVISDHGIGLTCDPLDPKAIAALMRWIIDNPEAAEAMGRKGREVVMAKYRWRNEAEKLVDFYHELCDPS